MLSWGCGQNSLWIKALFCWLSCLQSPTDSNLMPCVILGVFCEWEAMITIKLGWPIQTREYSQPTLSQVGWQPGGASSAKVHILRKRECVGEDGTLCDCGLRIWGCRWGRAWAPSLSVWVKTEAWHASGALSSAASQDTLLSLEGLQTWGCLRFSLFCLWYWQVTCPNAPRSRGY